MPCLSGPAPRREAARGLCDSRLVLGLQRGVPTARAWRRGRDAAVPRSAGAGHRRRWQRRRRGRRALDPLDERRDRRRNRHRSVIAAVSSTWSGRSALRDKQQHRRAGEPPGHPATQRLQRGRSRDGARAVCNGAGGIVDPLFEQRFDRRHRGDAGSGRCRTDRRAGGAGPATGNGGRSAPAPGPRPSRPRSGSAAPDPARAP